MKNWEMIKTITENPELTFKNLRFGGVVGYKENGTLAWISGTERNGEEFTIHYIPVGSACGNWNDDWELVPKPVDFMTAINSGKRISIKPITSQGQASKPITSQGQARFASYWLTMHDLSLDEINGKWFICS